MRTSTKWASAVAAGALFAGGTGVYEAYQHSKVNEQPVYADIDFGRANGNGKDLNPQEIANQHLKLPPKVKKAAHAVIYIYDAANSARHYVGNGLRVQKEPSSRYMVTVTPAKYANTHNQKYCGDSMQRNGFDGSGGYPISRSSAGVESKDGGEFASLKTEIGDGVVGVAKIAKNAPRLGEIAYLSAYSEADDGTLRSAYHEGFPDNTGTPAIFSGVIGPTTSEGYETVITGVSVAHSYSALNIDGKKVDTTDLGANSDGATVFNSDGQAVGLIEGADQNLTTSQINDKLGVNLQPDGGLFTIGYIKPLKQDAVHDLVKHAGDITDCVNYNNPDLGTFSHPNDPMFREDYHN